MYFHRVSEAILYKRLLPHGPAVRIRRTSDNGVVPVTAVLEVDRRAGTPREGMGTPPSLMTAEGKTEAEVVAKLQPHASDDRAIELMNDSPFGLTASVWTTDEEAAIRIGDRLETGTVFMNRCDYLDPALAWTGVKDSGRGCTLSRLGYDALTRPKSYHLKFAPR